LRNKSARAALFFLITGAPGEVFEIVREARKWK